MKKIPLLPTLCASALVLTLAGLTACSSTKLESSWKAPEVGSIHFNKVLVIAASPNITTRRAAEDAMRAHVPTAQVVTSYELFGDMGKSDDLARVKEAIKANNIDGIITMRAISDEKELNVNTTYMPTYGGYYGRGYGGYGYGYGMGYGSTTVTTDRIIGIETNIYDAKTEKLIWTAITKSTNLTKPEDFVKEVAEVVAKKMREQQLIPEAPKS